MITYACRIMLLFVLISFYSVYSYPKLEENFTVTFPKILRINDSVRIVVDSEVNIISDYKFNWKTNHGSIELSGKEVINGMGGAFPYNEKQSYFHLPKGPYLFFEKEEK